LSTRLSVLYVTCMLACSGGADKQEATSQSDDASTAGDADTDTDTDADTDTDTDTDTDSDTDTDTDTDDLSDRDEEVDWDDEELDDPVRPDGGTYPLGARCSSTSGAGSTALLLVALLGLRRRR